MRSMGFSEGLFYGMGKTYRKEDFKVFDWDKAARYILENNVKDAYAGLDGDWECTSGQILEDGKLVRDTYCYLCSPWATPSLMADGEEIECYLTYEENEKRVDKLTEDTKWPESAVSILKDAGYKNKE